MSFGTWLNCKNCSIINRTQFSNYKPAVNSVSVFLHETCLCDSLPILWLKFITIRCISWQPNNYIQLDLSPCAFSIKTHADCIKQCWLSLAANRKDDYTVLFRCDVILFTSLKTEGQGCLRAWERSSIESFIMWW